MLLFACPTWHQASRDARSEEELLTNACGDRRERVLHTVKADVSKVRQKLEKDPPKPSHFVTGYGVGYKFVQ
jgi:DNA-binding response OmpR family regulator